MKRIIGLLILLFSLTVSAQEISLDACLKSTRTHFPTLKQEEVIKVMNQALQRAIWYSYLPQISIDGGAAYQSHVTELAIDIPPLEIMPGTPAIEVGPIDLPSLPKFQYNAYIQATQLIWDGGNIRALGNEIQADTDARIAQMGMEMQKVEESVMELYFSLLILDAQNHLQEVLLEEIIRQKNRVENALKNGVATQNTLDGILVELIKAQQIKYQIEENRKAVIEALNIFTGLELSNSVTAKIPERPLPDIINNQSEIFAPARAEHAYFEAESKRAGAKLAAFLSEGMPKIALFARGGYGRPGLNMLDPNPNTFFSYGIKLNWNFGQLYSLNAQKKQMQGTKNLLQLQKETLEKDLQAKTIKQQNEAQQYDEILRRDNEILTLMENIVERARIQEEEGKLSTTEYLAQVTELNAMKQTRDLHRLQQLKALYKVVFTLGNQK